VDGPDSTTFVDSALTRPVALRMRPDLDFRPQHLAGRRYWGVKDPVSLEYFQLRDEEFLILQMLDGRTSLLEIKRRFERMFAPLQLSVERLQAFLTNLYREGLVLADSAGQGEQLLERRRRRRKRELVNRITGILAIRFRGFDPERLLCWLYPKCRWMFSPWSMAGALLLVLAALTLIFVQFDVLWSKIPDFHSFFSARNVFWLAVALMAAKVLHELGHALTCRHFGGECHEMGVIFLVFTPCLYCNVSDSWMLPNKWHRVAISAAGIFVEVVLAAAFTFLWWFSQPGLLNTLFLNVMFLCSVSTILFNGNPLLRYDGYYMLSDIIEVPNLAAQSGALLRRTFSRWCFGLVSADDLDLPDSRRRTVACYAVASTLYRWLIVLSILWFLHQVLQPYGLEVVSQTITAAVIIGMLIVPATSAVGFLKSPLQRRQFNKNRTVLTCLVGGLVLGAVCLIPVPLRVIAAVVVQPQDAERIYVSVPGQLVEAIEFGEVVQPGETLGRLKNLDLRREIARLTGEHRQLRKRLHNLELRRGQDPESSAQIPMTRERLSDVALRLGQREQDERELLLTAPCAGTVLPPPTLAAPKLQRDELVSWSGRLLDANNLGSPLEIGTLFCLVGDPERLEAVLVINQAEIEFVRSGQTVRIQLDEWPSTIFTGKITKVSEIDLDVAPRELLAGGELPARLDEHGTARPLETSYQARVPLEIHDGKPLIRARGRAKVIVDPQPLGRRLYRFLRRTFSFQG